MPRRKRTDTDGKSTLDTPPPGGSVAELEFYVGRLEVLLTQKADIQAIIVETLAAAEDHPLGAAAIHEHMRH